MSEYEFTTVWRFAAPLRSVWREIKTTEDWPAWWRGVLGVEKLREGDGRGVGAIYRTTWKSALPYRLVFDSEIVRIEDYELIEARAFGELEGRGLWQFETDKEDQTRVQYDWRVRTNKRWMNLIAPLARPFFRWNHDVIMNRGGRGLAARLDCRLL